MSAGGFLDACGFLPASSGTGDFVVSSAIQGFQTPAGAGAVNTTVYSYRAESADKSQWEIGFGAYTVSSTTLARTTVVAASTGSKVSFTAQPNVYVTAMSADLLNAGIFTNGTVPTARLGSGTASAATALFGDQSWKLAMFAGLDVASTDLNTIVTDGFRFIESSCTNQPVASNQFYLLTQKYPNGANYVQQTAWDLTSGKMYMRGQSAGSWSGWLQFNTNNASDLSSGTVPTARLGSGTANLEAFLRGDQFWLPRVWPSRNDFLSAIYASKSYGGYRRLIHLFADGYKASDGINAGSSSNYSVDTANGKLTNVTPSGAISGATGTTIGNMTGQGGLAAGFDGNTNQAYAASAATASAVPGSIGKNWGSALYAIASVQFWSTNGTGTVVYNSGNNGDTLTFDLRASNSAPSNYASDGVSLGTTTDTNGGGATRTKTITSSNLTTLYQYVWVYMTSSAQSGGNLALAEVQFTSAAVTANMVAVTTTQTADASVSTGKAVLEFDNTASLTLGTDLTVELTANGGTNWAAATLSSVSTNGQAGRTVIETAETALTAGTSFAARVKTFNSKSCPIYGLGIAVR